MIENIEKVFFIPGDLVTIKHDLPNKPTMLVKGKETKTFKDAETYFIGIKCFWFRTDGEYQEQVFNTKDLQRLTKEPSVDYSKFKSTGTVTISRANPTDKYSY